MKHRHRALGMAACAITLLVLSSTGFAQRQGRPPRNAANEPLPKSEVKIQVEGQTRVISANGIPQHETGRFPNRRNPNTIRPQRYEYRMPADPKVANRTTPLTMQPFGIAVNGVLFDPGAAEFWNRDRNSGWQYEPLSSGIDLGTDDSNAHVQPNGAYHYHGLPIKLFEKLQEKDSMTLLGFAADGFPMYGVYGHKDPEDPTSELVELKPSFQLKKGIRPDGPRGKFDGTFVQDYEYIAGSGDLDECNGRTGITPEFPEGTYYYVVTDSFPFIPRAFRGTPDPSFQRRGRGPRPRFPLPFPPPPGRPGGIR